MFDGQGARRLSVLSVSLVGFLFLSILTLSTVRGSGNGSPTLTGGKVTPEKGAASSTFAFEVVYSDPDNLLPSNGYPTLYIDGETVGRAMVENDPMDNNVADGKLYKYEWTPSIENEIGLPIFENFKVNNRDLNPRQEAVFSGYLIDNHNFYFYAQNSLGENARDPESNVQEGPETSVSGATVKLFLLTGENSVEGVGSDNTNENGYFSISIEAPSSGSYGYYAEFQGGENNQTSQSDIVALITFNVLSIAAISWAISVVLIVVLIFFLSRGISRSQYLKPLIIGFLFVIVLPLLAGPLFGLIVAGAIAGYMYAGRVSGFIRHLRLGALIAMLLMLLNFSITAFLIRDVAANYVTSDFGYSISNGQLLELLIFGTFFSAIFYGLFVGLGAVLGGILRKALKPAEQRPVTVAGSDTTAASGSRLQG
jgi:hypothetical protein